MSTDEIIMHEGVTAVYKVNVDLFFAVVGAQNENEVYYLACWKSIVLFEYLSLLPLQLMLVGVLNALYDSISQLLR